MLLSHSVFQAVQPPMFPALHPTGSLAPLTLPSGNNSWEPPKYAPGPTWSSPSVYNYVHSCFFFCVNLLSCWFVHVGHKSSTLLSNEMYIFNTSSAHSGGSWQEVKVTENNWVGLSQRLRLAGHSAVIYSDLNMLIVYGGYTMRRRMWGFLLVCKGFLPMEWNGGLMAHKFGRKNRKWMCPDIAFKIAFSAPIALFTLSWKGHGLFFQNWSCSAVLLRAKIHV